MDPKYTAFAVAVLAVVVGMLLFDLASSYMNTTTATA